MGELAALGERWEKAYRRFTAADEANRYTAADDPTAAARIAPTYREVARLWRELAAHSDTPWWAKAAALHAAETFDHQADNNDRVVSGEGSGHVAQPADDRAASQPGMFMKGGFGS